MELALICTPQPWVMTPLSRSCQYGLILQLPDRMYRMPPVLSWTTPMELMGAWPSRLAWDRRQLYLTLKLYATIGINILQMLTWRIALGWNLSTLYDLFRSSMFVQQTSSPQAEVPHTTSVV